MMNKLNIQGAAGFSPRESANRGSASHAGRSRRLKPAALCVLTCALVCAPLIYAQTATEQPPPDPTNPPQGRFADYWMAIMLAGQKMGYVHSEQERVSDKIHTRTRTHLMFRRAATPLEITMKTSSTETITGQPLAFSTEEKLGQFPVRKRGTIQDGMITLETEQFGQRNKQQIAYPAGALMEWGLQLEALKHKPEPGTVIKAVAFVPAQALNVGMPTTIEILEREEIEILGEPVSALKTKTTMVINGVNIEAVGWVDDDLSPIKQEMELMGLKFEMLRCDMAFAL